MSAVALMRGRLTVALTDEELQMVHTIARLNRTTASEMVRVLVRRFLTYAQTKRSGIPK